VSEQLTTELALVERSPLPRSERFLGFDGHRHRPSAAQPSASGSDDRTIAQDS